MKIKKGDNILVTAGKDRGRSGRIEKVFPESLTVVVPGINEYKRHRKPGGENRPGEIVTLVRPIDVAKIAVVCPKCKLVTRVGYRLDGDKKIRICRKCKNDLDEVKTQKSKVKDVKDKKTK